MKAPWASRTLAAIGCLLGSYVLKLLLLETFRQFIYYLIHTFDVIALMFRHQDLRGRVYGIKTQANTHIALFLSPSGSSRSRLRHSAGRQDQEAGRLRRQRVVRFGGESRGGEASPRRGQASRSHPRHSFLGVALVRRRTRRRTTPSTCFPRVYEGKRRRREREGCVVRMRKELRRESKWRF